MDEKVTNRWLIAAGGVLMQLALGAVYAWSVFRKPLSEEFGAILLCYWDGFGTMSAFAADHFGSRNVGRIYGFLLTAWAPPGARARC